MEAKTVRSEKSILRDLQGVSNGNTTYVRRTIEKPYIDVFKGGAVLHLPYGKDGYDFAFGIDKMEAIHKLVENGTWNATVKMMRDTQMEMQLKKAKMEDVIQL
jgi:hypothetical protein